MAKREPPPEPDAVAQDPLTGEWHFRYEPAVKAKAAKGPLPLETVSLASLAGKPLPRREFLDERKIFPMAEVTMMTGDGGAGKSLIALQLAMAVAIGGSWLNFPVRAGRVVFVSAEDSLDECHIRATEIAAADGLDIGLFAALDIVPLAGLDAVLAEGSLKGRLKLTPLYERLRLAAALRMPLELLVIDNRSDTFAGDENNRAHTRQFINALHAVAIETGAAVLLLAHPSLAGINSGSGLSGSTAWNNSVRSRLYLRKPGNDEPGADDNSARVLETMKANRGPAGGVINVRWDCGRYVCTDRPERAGADIGKADRAERVFLALLNLHNERGDFVSARTKARNYAPKVFAAHPKREGLTPRLFAAAMESLFEKGAIRSVRYGPPSDDTWKLEVEKCNF